MLTLKTHLQLQARHPRHAHIRDHAFTGAGLVGLQKGLGGGKTHSFHIQGLNQPLHQAKHDAVIINEVNPGWKIDLAHGQFLIQSSQSSSTKPLAHTSQVS